VAGASRTPRWRGCLALAWIAPPGAFGDPDGSNNLVTSGWLVIFEGSFGRDHSQPAEI
jgi:hypothetical protein